MCAEVLQGDAGEAVAYQGVLQERERGAAVPVQERVGGENLDVEANCGEYEVVEMDCVGLRRGPEPSMRLPPPRQIAASCFRLVVGIAIPQGSLRTHSTTPGNLGSSQDAVPSCQASSSASAAAAAAILAATSSSDDSVVSNPEREASKGLTSRRASKVVP
jgi:hypothetical protein